MREIIEQLAKGIWVDGYCYYCGLNRDEGRHSSGCLVGQAKESLRLNIDGSRKVEPTESFVGMDNIIAGAIESFRDTLIDRFNIHIPKGTTTDFFIAHGIHWLNSDPTWFVGDHVDRALKVITNALKSKELTLFDLLPFKQVPIYMKFDPETGLKIPSTTPELYRENHTGVAWLYNPYTGDKRDSRDIGSDVFGLLMVAPDESIKAMKE